MKTGDRVVTDLGIPGTILGRVASPLKMPLWQIAIDEDTAVVIVESKLTLQEGEPIVFKGKIAPESIEVDPKPSPLKGLKAHKVTNPPKQPEPSVFARVEGSGVTKVKDTSFLELSLDEAYAEVKRVSGISEAELRSRYVKLNPGMQKMNLVNRLRAAARGGTRS